MVARYRAQHPPKAKPPERDAPTAPEEALPEGAAEGRVPQPGPPKPDGSFDPFRGRGLWGNEHGPVTPRPADEAFNAEVGDEVPGTQPTQRTSPLILVCRAPAPGQPCAELYWNPQTGKFESPPEASSVPRALSNNLSSLNTKKTPTTGGRSLHKTPTQSWLIICAARAGR